MSDDVFASILMGLPVATGALLLLIRGWPREIERRRRREDAHALLERARKAHPPAGGSLICKVDKAITEFKKTGLIDKNSKTKVYGAQATGCNPITHAFKEGWELFKPTKPNTIAKSIAIGNPADGFQVLRAVRATGGSGAMVEEHEVVDGIRLLAETEGIFTEPAGGVTVAATRHLIARGVLPRDESIVICITGNGYKTIEVLSDLPQPIHIGRSLADFEASAAAPASAGVA